LRLLRRRAKRQRGPAPPKRAAPARACPAEARSAKAGEGSDARASRADGAARKRPVADDAEMKESRRRTVIRKISIHSIEFRILKPGSGGPRLRPRITRTNTDYEGRQVWRVRGRPTAGHGRWREIGVTSASGSASLVPPISRHLPPREARHANTRIRRPLIRRTTVWGCPYSPQLRCIREDPCDPWPASYP
jgi:hypothetical protein